MDGRQSWEDIDATLALVASAAEVTGEVPLYFSLMYWLPTAPRHLPRCARRRRRSQSCSSGSLIPSIRASCQALRGPAATSQDLALRSPAWAANGWIY